MPRLTKAQREARDERKTAVAAQIAADAQTADLPPGSIDAPPPPSASALSTNQPQAAAVIASEAFAAASASHTLDRSSSALSDTPARADSLGGQSPSATPAVLGRRSRSRSPLGAASDMSTSDGSGNEDDGKDKSITVDGAVDELEGDDDDEMAVASNGTIPEVKCMWEDCGKVYTSLAPFIAHLHEDHVGIHKARYACEWTGCPRKGKMQTSRFALLSHLRSHTGEKPFTCPKPECDKSFTRSDALAKHMRVQHNINPVSNRGRGAKAAAAAAAAAAAREDSVHNSGGRASKGRGVEDDDETMGEESVDAVGDELLELAEGEDVPSTAEIETSLALKGASSFAYTYDNLFGPGARTLDSYTGAVGHTDEELGIIRDTLPIPGPLLGEDQVDEIVAKREEEDSAKVLEAGRKLWIERERARAKRAAEDEGEDADEWYEVESASGTVLKRRRRSEPLLDSDELSTARPLSGPRQVIDGNKVKKLYLIEKAKLRMLQRENDRMRDHLNEMRELELEEKIGKRDMLEKALEAELGRDVAAIFSPPPSPPRRQ